MAPMRPNRIQPRWVMARDPGVTDVDDATDQEAPAVSGRSSSPLTGASWVGVSTWRKRLPRRLLRSRHRHPDERRTVGAAPRPLLPACHPGVQRVPEGRGRMPERDGYIPGVPCWVDTSQPDPEAALDFYGGLFGW